MSWLSREPQFLSNNRAALRHNGLPAGPSVKYGISVTRLRLSFRFLKMLLYNILSSEENCTFFWVVFLVFFLFFVLFCFVLFCFYSLGSHWEEVLGEITCHLLSSLGVSFQTV